ncbi:MAG: heme ABC exporter ATP-binding protein CcmA [Proteobacteria bacterium]|nr:heme ABC exporter ATP-binding protein CcmA [Pseudomonadota bacterium]
MNDHAASTTLLAVARLCFDRNDERVFGPLTFIVDSGEALLVTGGNGAGKTTLLRVLAGLLRASEGELRWQGEPCAALPAESIAFVGHHPGHKADLSTLDNLRYAAGLHGCRASASPTAALASVGLAGYEDTPAGRLSAGQRKRLSLARLLLAPASLWLLDEPYANLDRDGMALVDHLLSRHLQDGGAALITTHGAYAPPPLRCRTLLLDGVDGMGAADDIEMQLDTGVGR